MFIFGYRLFQRWYVGTLNSMGVTHNMNNELSSLKNILLHSQQPSPVKVYQRHVRKFKEWCQKLELNSLPAAEEALLLFLTTQFRTGASTITLQHIVYGIKWQHDISEIDFK